LKSAPPAERKYADGRERFGLGDLLSKNRKRDQCTKIDEENSESSGAAGAKKTNRKRVHGLEKRKGGKGKLKVP